MYVKEAGESIPSIPDRYFHNEMKREVTAIVNSDPVPEMVDAFQHINILELQDLISAGDQAPSSQWSELVSEADSVRNATWEYLTDCYNETVNRRGYSADDMRGLMVALSSACVRVARAVDAAKVRLLGHDASTGFTNAFTSYIFNNSANSLITNGKHLIEPSTSKFAAKMAVVSFEKTGYTRNHESWSWTKIHTLAEALECGLVMNEILSKLPEVSDADAEMLQRHNLSFSQAANSLNTFTPKPAIGKIEGTDIQTLFVDRDVSQAMLLSSIPASDFTVVALFHGDTSLTSSNSDLEYSIAYKNSGGIAKRIHSEDMSPSKPRAQLLIRKNHELRFNSDYLADFAEGLGMKNQAALLTSLLLRQNFDLIAPSYIVDLSNEEAETIQKTHDAHPEADKLRRLLLARTRVLNILGKDIDKQISNEISESEKVHKDIQKHGVVGHLRRLPNGYSPSAQAKKLCREQLGVNIPEGHTYVQKHTRGNIEVDGKGHEIVTHKAAGRVAMQDSVQ